MQQHEIKKVFNGRLKTQFGPKFFKEISYNCAFCNALVVTRCGKSILNKLKEYKATCSHSCSEKLAHQRYREQEHTVTCLGLRIGEFDEILQKRTTNTRNYRYDKLEEYQKYMECCSLNSDEQLDFNKIGLHSVGLRSIYYEYSNKYVAEWCKSHKLIIVFCDYCGKRIEIEYHKSYLNDIINRGYIACDMSQAVQLRTICRPDDVRIACAKKIGEYTTKRNREFWDNMTEEHLSEMMKKSFETMKNNGSINSLVSKDELKARDFLYEIYGKENVKHQAFINRWSIDFYIRDVEAARKFYLEIDGVYWHGLNLLEEELKALASKARNEYAHDYIRHRKLLSDKERDLWFKEKNLLLIRITDKELKQVNSKYAFNTLLSNKLILGELEEDKIGCCFKK